MKSVRDLVGEAREQIEQVAPRAASEELASGGMTIVDVREPVATWPIWTAVSPPGRKRACLSPSIMRG